MCIVIFAGNKHQPLYETGMDQFNEINGLVSEDDFFDKNLEPGKLYPGGWMYTFKGVDIQCMC